jgi:hypothetical protein
MSERRRSVDNLKRSLSVKAKYEHGRPQLNVADCQVLSLNVAEYGLLVLLNVANPAPLLQNTSDFYDTLPLTAKGATLYGYTVALRNSEVYVNNLTWIDFYLITATFYYEDYPTLFAYVARLVG